MKFDLVEMVTKDNLIHQGIFAMPKKPGKKAILWVHGLTGKFYGDALLMNLFADVCNEQGIGFASFNTRGHDVIANGSTIDPNDPSGFGHRMIGAAYENFEECIVDIDAAVGFLMSRGFTAIIIAGHSTGANKVCYYAATQNDTRMAGAILAGPMSDRFSPQNDKEEYEKNIAMLKNLRDKGKGDALLTKANWFPSTADRTWSLIAPNTSEDVFNYGDKENALSAVEKINVPLLVVFSGNDEYADRPIEDIKQVFDAHAKSTNYKSIIIPDTTHSYERKEKEFVSAVVDWSSLL